MPTYPGAVLGTPETVRAIAKHGVEIGSSGVSTAHNEAIAARAGGMGVSWNALGRNVGTGAAVGAVLGVGIAVYEANERHQIGEGSWQKLFDEALRNALVGIAVGGAGALAGTVASAVLPAGNVAIVGGLIVGIGAALVISKITDEQWAAFFGAATAFLATVNSMSPEADASAT